MNSKAQVSIFVIIALAIVAAIVLFFFFRGGLGGEEIPEGLRGVYGTYLGCVEEQTRLALDLASSQGGRIEVGAFAPGSDYAPFSSHLNFAGLSIPYWYYVAGNALIKENVPSKADIESEIEEYLEQEIENCDFSSFYTEGFEIGLGGVEGVGVNIEENRVSVEVKEDVSISRGDESARKTSHNIEVSSKIGKFYRLSRELYDKQRSEAFLENYAVDVLRLYAPVDGVEIQCSPKIWATREVVDELQSGLQANIGALKLRGDYYELPRNDTGYFVIDKNVDEAVNFLYLEDWPSKFEITPADEEIMIAEPVGNQQGLGIMGFCYTSYHFIYDVSFPVLIQIYDGAEIFQFPVVVVIDNNLPREANLQSIIDEQIESDVCAFKEKNVEIKTFDVNLNPVEAEISYKCFDSLCGVGETVISEGDAVLKAELPACLNGQLIARAEGYSDSKKIFSSNSESFAELILDREYEVSVGVRVGEGGIGENTGVVHFRGEDGVESAILPDNRKVRLKEGTYDVEVFVYGDSDVTIPSTTKRQCYEVSRGGLFGLFGRTKEECVNVEIPEVKIDYALTAGGKTSAYLLESDLRTGELVIYVSELPKPTSLEQLQYNFEVFDKLGVDIRTV